MADQAEIRQRLAILLANMSPLDAHTILMERLQKADTAYFKSGMKDSEAHRLSTRDTRKMLDMLQLDT